MFTKKHTFYAISNFIFKDYLEILRVYTTELSTRFTNSGYDDEGLTFL